MKKQFGEYQRLARGVFGCSSLWRGGDHLLYVRGKGFLIPFSEEYLRIRFADIQALVIVGTSGRLLSGILYGLGALLFGGLCGLIMSLREPGELGPLVIMLLFPLPLVLLCLVLFVRTLLLGQRCLVDVQTSLKKERLRMLTRLPVARAVLDSLEEDIRKVQENLPGVDGGASFQARGGSEQDQVITRRLMIPASALPAFVASLIMGGLMLFQVHVESAVVVWTTQVMGVLLVPLILFAIASSVRHLTADGLRFVLWGLAASLFAIGSGGVVYFVATAVENPAVTVSIAVYIKAFATVNSDTTLGFYLYFLIMGLVMILLGFIGLAQVVMWKNLHKKESE